MQILCENKLDFYYSTFDVYFFLSGDNFSIVMTGGKLAKLLETYTVSLLGVKWPGAYTHTQFLGLVPSSSH